MFVALAAPPAVAQDRAAEPSADRLREEYPLHATPAPAAGEASTPAARAATRSAARQPEDDGGAFVVDALVLLEVAVAYVAGLVLGLVVGGRRRRQRDRTGPARPPPAPDRPPPAPATHASPVPPAPEQEWTAEIEWRHQAGAGRFRVVARTAGRRGLTPILDSGPLEWPPTGPDALDALTRAADGLERRLLDAGWAALPPGEAWYARRFAWRARTSRAATAGRGRFRRSGAEVEAGGGP